MYLGVFLKMLAGVKHNLVVALLTSRANAETMRVFMAQLRQLHLSPVVIDALYAHTTRTMATPVLALLDMGDRTSSSASSLSMSVRSLWEHTPIILFTDEVDVELLRMEAQFMDFLTLPISLPALDIRLRFCLMRSNKVAPTGDLIEVAGVSLNLATREVTLNKRPVTLTFKEFELLRFFFTSPRRAYTRDEFLASVWEIANGGDTRTVDMHIQRLRAKLGTRVGNMIHTIRNVGYRFG